MRQLRTMVEKWLGPASATRVRVTRLAGKADGRHGVRVEIEGARGPISLHFFRHRDGAWQVFPPAQARLTMGGDPAVIE